MTENAITDQKDVNRESFLTAHLLELHRAIEEVEVPVKGYLHWSLTDNYERSEDSVRDLGFSRSTTRQSEEPQRKPSEFTEE